MKKSVAAFCIVLLSGCGGSPGTYPDPNNAWNPLLSFEVRRAAWAAGAVKSTFNEASPRLVTYFVGPEDKVTAWMNSGSSPNKTYRMGYFEFEGHFKYTAFGGKGTSTTIETNRVYVTVAEDHWQNIVQQGYGPGTAKIPFDEKIDWERYWADKWDGTGSSPSPIERVEAGS